MKCRHCTAELHLVMADLGASPPSNAFNVNADAEERHYPLRVLVCEECWLVQTDTSLFTPGYDELFTDEYPYFSSTSAGWVEHARDFVEMATKRFSLGRDSLTVEIGANDGYLLQFVKTPCYGVEPTRTGDVAKAKGITIYPQFFSSAWAINAAQLRLKSAANSKSSAAEFIDGRADFIIANNVLAHVPDINDFVKGVSILLKDSGVASFEFPHLLNLVQKNQFDTIYHEHYSYLSLVAVQRIFAAHGLTVFDVEKLKTHGGSLRVYVAKDRSPFPSVADLVREEIFAGVRNAEFYRGFQKRLDAIKNEFVAFLLRAKNLHLSVVGFGAAAKGNTLLNYSGVRSDLIEYVVDETPAKQGKFLPGSRIPVQKTFTSEPDYVVVFPWNFRAEITRKLANMKAKLVFAIPQLEIV